MNNKFHPWAAPLKAPLPAQKLSPSQDGINIMKWEEYQAIKKARADEERKLKNRKWCRENYYRTMSNEEKYRKRKIRNRMNNQRWRAAKKEKESTQKKKIEESIQKKKEEQHNRLVAAELLLSLGKGG